jgi:hypothetical protein
MLRTNKGAPLYAPFSQLTSMAKASRESLQSAMNPLGYPFRNPDRRISPFCSCLGTRYPHYARLSIEEASNGVLTEKPPPGQFGDSEMPFHIRNSGMGGSLACDGRV